MVGTPLRPLNSLHRPSLFQTPTKEASARPLPKGGVRGISCPAPFLELSGQVLVATPPPRGKGCVPTEGSVFLLPVGGWSGLKATHSGICCVFSLSKAFYFSF